MSTISLRFSIPHLLQQLDIALIRIASDPQMTESNRVQQSLDLVRDTAAALGLVWIARAYFSEQDRIDYEMGKSQVLIYLLYYDRLERWMHGDAAPSDFFLPDLFPSVDYPDWQKAEREAGKLFVQYLRNQPV